jgi:hypothetical protein
MSIDSTAVQQEHISFSGTVTREQYLLVHRLLLAGWRSLPAMGLYVVIIAQIFDLGIHDASETQLQGILANLWGAVGLFVLMWGTTVFARRRQWRKMDATQRDITGSIGEAGIEWSTPMTTARFPWSKLVKVRQHREMLLIFYNASCALYAPKQFFATETEWREANALALRRLSAKP